MSTPQKQKPLELILARNLLTSVSTPAFLVDSAATIVFYNEAAAALLGRSFEEAGRMTAEQWTAAFGPFGADDEPLDVDSLATTEAIRAGRPAHGRFKIKAAQGTVTVEASAIPIVASEQGSSGAMILFWPQVDDADGASKDGAGGGGH